tara:strand:+ start:687 stop:2354 length:1668 start_codon:yes stop_codon:yes gene_type:complete
MIENMTYPKVEPGKRWKATLFDHQLTAIHLLEDREENQDRILCNDTKFKSNVGVFSDPTGYGKTLSVVGLIERDRMEWDLDTPHLSEYIDEYSHSSNSVFYMTRTHKYKKIKTTLILVNQSIITQWENEMKLMRIKNYKIINKRKLADETDITPYDVVLVIPTMYNRLVNRYRNVTFKRFIYDEPVNIHVPAMKEVRAGFYWFVTATPDQLRYRNGSTSKTHFLRSIFNGYMSSNILKKLCVRNNLDYVKKSYVFPKTNYIEHECYQPLFNMCRNYIDNTTSDMISAGNILGAIRRLGGNETSNIFELIKQKLNYRIEHHNSSIRLLNMNHNRNHSQSAIEHHKQKIEELTKQLSEVESKFKERLESDCSICLGKLEKPVLITCCQNIMCGSCILEWKKTHSTCPLCRSDMTADCLTYIKKKHESPSQEKKCNRRKTKPETILDIITNNNKGKFIVFSNYSESFGHIHRVLQENNISYKELQGQTSTRNKTIKEFKRGDIKVMFLNSKNNGAGINLQEATDIILYHQLEKDLETQVVGRANRIGRKQELFVHQLK